MKPKLYNQLIFCFYHPFLHWRSGWSVNSTLSISEEIEVELKFYYFHMTPYWEIDFRSRSNLRNFSSVFKYWILFLRRIFSCVYALENVAAELSHPIFLFEYLKRAINKMLNYWFSSKQTNLQFKVSICKFCQTRSFWRAFFVQIVCHRKTVFKWTGQLPKILLDYLGSERDMTKERHCLLNT